MKILHIMVGQGSYGGAEHFAISYLDNMNTNIIGFDFLFLHQNTLTNVKTACLRNSNIFELGTWKIKGNGIINFLKTVKELGRVIREGKYEIIHVNSGIIKVQIMCLFSAKISGVKVRIAHSHTSNSANGNKREGISHKIKAWLVRHFATDYFACSRAAGEYLFGDKGITSDNFKIIKNAIALEKYKFNARKREYINFREKENHKPVFAHVGRFTEVKNQKFVIDVYKELHELIPDSFLWMIGTGELFDEIINYAKRIKIDNFIRFFGQRDDVPDLLQSIDALIFPSFHEGLSIVIVEAQACGVNVFASDTLSREHILSSNIHFISLNNSALQWAKEIATDMKSFRKSDDQSVLLREGYDIKIAAIELEEFYFSKNIKQ